MAELSADFCVITHPDQTDRFIRAVLYQKVIGDCRQLEYGLWTSLSEKSFNDYVENFNDENHEAQYFGWLSNNLPDYKFKESIPLTVVTQGGNARPKLTPYEDVDHPFVRDYYNGITKKEAERRIRHTIANVPPPATQQQQKKAWWKLWK
jgi:hypothetical protein